MSNVISIRGGVVHARLTQVVGVWPLCRTNQRGLYAPTDAPVTCKNCGPDSVEANR